MVTADRPGIVTWVVPSEGAATVEGEALARVADLDSYRVDATLSDVLARRLTVGLPAMVRSGETRLDGRVHKILPTVENGIVTFEVLLDEPAHEILRPNLRVDVHAVTDRRTDTLCLRRGPLLNVDGRDHVFVVRGDRAGPHAGHRRPFQLRVVRDHRRTGRGRRGHHLGHVRHRKAREVRLR